MVTISGRLLVVGETLNEGKEKMKLEKNQPLIIVPIDSRNKAFLRFLFSSPIGEREAMDGLREKQK